MSSKGNRAKVEEVHEKKFDARYRRLWIGSISCTSMSYSCASLGAVMYVEDSGEG